MKRKQYPIHPDFKKWSKMNPPLNRTMIPITQKLLGVLFDRERKSRDLSVTKEYITSSDGSTIRALLYSPIGIAANAPCLLYCHGGGFVMPAAPYHYSLVKEYALRAQCKVLFVDYRLAPKHPFPAAPEDCYSAYCHVISHSAELSVDPRRIAVSGDSAGAQLAMLVCLMAKDYNQIMPCGQMLMYPAVGHLPESESMKKYVDTPMCSSRDMEKYYKYYMQNENIRKGEYSSPIKAQSYKGLPSAYIETAEFDPLHDGGVLYAKRLLDDGIPTVLTNTRGTIHGFDIVLNSPIVRKCVDDRIAFLSDVFACRQE